MEYDCENRLLVVEEPAPLINVCYGYDLLGRRNRRFLTFLNEETVYVWDGAHVIAEYVNGSLAKKYIYGPGMDNPVAMVNVSGNSAAARAGR